MANLKRLVGRRGFLLFTCALYWFDPLVWLMARVAGRDMEAARSAYASLLTDFLDRRTLPDGTVLPATATDDDLSRNRFAVADVDMDTTAENIILNEHARRRVRFCMRCALRQQSNRAAPDPLIKIAYFNQRLVSGAF